LTSPSFAKDGRKGTFQGRVITGKGGGEKGRHIVDAHTTSPKKHRARLERGVLLETDLG